MYRLDAHDKACPLSFFTGRQAGRQAGKQATHKGKKMHWILVVAYLLKSLLLALLFVCADHLFWGLGVLFCLLIFWYFKVISSSSHLFPLAPSAWHVFLSLSNSHGERLTFPSTIVYLLKPFAFFLLVHGIRIHMIILEPIESRFYMRKQHFFYQKLQNHVSTANLFGVSLNC